jgi:D-alanyl-D-alanine carboxypeptidase
MEQSLTTSGLATSMRRAIAVVAVVLLTASGCGSDSAPAPSATHGSIKGTITDNTGLPVQNAPVTLTGNGQAARSTKTGTDGAYTFDSVLPATYTLTGAPPIGYTAASVDTASVTVAAGAQANATVLFVGRTPETSFVVALDAQLKSATAANTFSGAVLVVRDGHTVFEGAYGLMHRDLGITNSTLTQFRVASVNKMFTAVAVLHLVQAGKVQLDAPFGTYLTDYPNGDMASSVTIHHLLTHTGGTGDIEGMQFDSIRQALREVDDYVAHHGSRAALFAPGTMYQYSNFGFILLGAVIERVSGMRYDDYIAEHILAPAGMTDTGAEPENTLVPGRSVSYMPDQQGALVSSVPILPYRGTPTGGWYSTVRDLERFVAAIREHRLLDPAFTALMLEGKVPINQTWKYAYGFFERLQFGSRFLGHNGSLPGVSATLVFEPEGGYTVVVLSNFSWPAAGNIETYILTNRPN